MSMIGSGSPSALVSPRSLSSSSVLPSSRATKAGASSAHQFSYSATYSSLVGSAPPSV